MIEKQCLPRPFVKIYQTRLYHINYGYISFDAELNGEYRENKCNLFGKAYINDLIQILDEIDHPRENLCVPPVSAVGPPLSICQKTYGP